MFIHQHPGMAPQMVPCHGSSQCFMSCSRQLLLTVCAQCGSKPCCCLKPEQHRKVAWSSRKEGCFPAANHNNILPRCVHQIHAGTHSMQHITLCVQLTAMFFNLGVSCPHSGGLKELLPAWSLVPVRALEGTAALLGHAEVEGGASTLCECDGASNDVGVCFSSSDNAEGDGVDVQAARCSPVACTERQSLPVSH